MKIISDRGKWFYLSMCTVLNTAKTLQYQYFLALTEFFLFFSSYTVLQIAQKR